MNRELCDDQATIVIDFYTKLHRLFDQLSILSAEQTWVISLRYSSAILHLSQVSAYTELRLCVFAFVQHYTEFLFRKKNRRHRRFSVWNIE